MYLHEDGSLVVNGGGVKICNCLGKWRFLGEIWEHASLI